MGLGPLPVVRSPTADSRMQLQIARCCLACCRVSDHLQNAPHRLATQLACPSHPKPRWCARRHVDDMRVCSHRARLGGVDGVASGSLAAYSTLVKAGVSCFDIDFVQASRQRAAPTELMLRGACCGGSSGGSINWRHEASSHGWEAVRVIFWTAACRRYLHAWPLAACRCAGESSHTGVPDLTGFAQPPHSLADLGWPAAGHASGRPAGCCAER